MSSNPPTPPTPDQRERAEKLEELQQQLQDGARAAGRGLAPEAASRNATPQVKPEVIPEPEGPWPPWGPSGPV